MKAENQEFFQMAGQFLKEKRIAAGISDHDVAEALGVAIAYYRNMEAGRDKIQLPRFLKALHVIGVTLLEIQEGENGSVRVKGFREC